MSPPQLEPLLCASVRGAGDPAQAISEVRTQLRRQEDARDNSDELFATAARRWVDQEDTDVTTFRFLLLVIACGWEHLLVQLLLQHHVSDAADDMKELLPFCSQLSESSAATLVLPVLDALLAVAVSFALAYPRRSGHQEEDTDSLLLAQLMNQASCCPSCPWSRFPLAKSIMFARIKAQQPSDEAQWTRFMRLSRDLDARRFDSKTGRALNSAIAIVAGQQERVLALIRLRREESRDPIDKVDQEADRRVVMDKMQEVARQVLLITNLCDVDSVCERCASNNNELGGYPKARISVDSTGVEDMSLIADDAALESYLARRPDSVNTENGLHTRQQKVVTANGNSSLSSVPATESTCFKKLLDAVSTDALPSVSDVGDLVQKTYDELSMIADLDALGNQISFLLSAQLRSRRSVVELDGAVGGNLRRQVLREFNSLTDGADQGRSVRTLLVLAGLCPSLILREIMSRAMTAPQHIQTYVRILKLCPILVEWKDEEAPQSPVLTRELQSTLREIVSAEPSFEEQQTHFRELLCALAGLSGNVLTKGEDTSAAIDVQTLVRDVLLPVYDSIIGLEQVGGESAAAADTATRTAMVQMSKYFLFVRDFVRCAVSETRWRSTTSGIQTLKKLLRVLVGVYERNCGSLTIQSVDLQNTLLLTIKDLLEFVTPLQEAVVSDIVKTSIGDTTEMLDEPLLMLIAHAIPDVYDWMAVREEFITLRRLSEDVDNRLATKEAVIDLGQARRIVRLLLWRLLWSSVSPSDSSVTNASQNQSLLSAERAWVLLEALANGTISDSTVCEVGRVSAGRALVQKELAHLMLVCRTSLFSTLNAGVLPRLVKISVQSTPSATMVELKLPNQVLAPHLDPKHSEANRPAALECELPLSHSVMKFVSRAWSLLVLSSEQSEEDDAVESEVLLQMARHFLVTCDRAVSDSKSSLIGLLHCFQLVCFVLCVLSCEGRMRDSESCDSIKSQLNVSLIRLLHLLSQLRLTKTDESLFSHHFVASWMAQLPPDSFEQARNFVASARD